MSSVNPEYRLRNLERRLKDLLLGRRLSADPERTGVVDLSDFGSRCRELAEFSAQSVSELEGARGAEAACARRVVEDVELAAATAGLWEGAPPGRERLDRQIQLLQDALQEVGAALRAACLLEEPKTPVSLSGLARREARLFAPFLSFQGKIADAPPVLLEEAWARRRLRRELLRAASVAGEGGAEGRIDYPLSVSRSGVLRFGEEGEISGEAVAAEELTRSPHEPTEAKRALDMREASTDRALRDFLLLKAVEECLFAVLAPRLRGSELVARARAVPHGSGKKMSVRPETVAQPIPGWDAAEAARGVEKLAERRIGPEWARLPKGAYLLRLFLSEDDRLAEDLLALGPALRRMEKGAAVEGTEPRGLRALQGLLGLLG